MLFVACRIRPSIPFVADWQLYLFYSVFYRKTCFFGLTSVLVHIGLVWSVVRSYVVSRRFPTKVNTGYLTQRYGRYNFFCSSLIEFEFTNRLRCLVRLKR